MDKKDKDVDRCSPGSADDEKVVTLCALFLILCFLGVVVGVVLMAHKGIPPFEEIYPDVEGDTKSLIKVFLFSLIFSLILPVVLIARPLLKSIKSEGVRIFLSLCFLGFMMVVAFRMHTWF